MVKYYYLKLGKGNCLVEYWLNQKGERNLYKEEYKHAVAIYFGRNTVEDIGEYSDLYYKRGDSREEAFEKFKQKLNRDNDKAKRPDLKAAIDFVKAGKSPRNTKFITITHNKVYIYEPESEVNNLPEDKYGAYDADLDKLSEAEKNKAVAKRIEGMKVKPKGQTEPQHIPKIMPVRFLKNPCSIKKVPHVLASLPCNQYLTRGTFREIDPTKNWGAIQAIKHCLNEQLNKPETFRKLTNFLSSYELETLVFLILTNAGLFVPAWRGGTQKGFDMIAHNFTNSTIQIPSITFESKDNAKSSFTFQVKKGKVKKHSEFADFTIATEYDGDDDKILNTDWLLEIIKERKDTRDWFVNLLKWVGENEITSLIEK